jgi:hypothetical protein
MTFGHTLGLQGAFCQNGQKMVIFLKLRKSPQNILYPSPISVPNDRIFCQNVLNRSPNTVTERYLENIFFFGQKFKFEFWAFFRAFTSCSKTNKIISYLKINKIFGFCMVDLVIFFYKNQAITLNF